MTKSTTVSLRIAVTLLVGTRVLFGPIGPLAAQPADEKDAKLFSKKIEYAYDIPFPKYQPGPSYKSATENADVQRLGLLGERFHAAKRAFEGRASALQVNTTTEVLESLIDAMTRFTDSEVALCPLAVKPTDQDYLNAYERAVKFAVAVEYLVETRHKAGKVPSYQVELIRYQRLSMQIKLLESKKKKDERK
jgi:hypothetical protein